MRKRTFQRALIITVLVMLTGCTSMQVRMSIRERVSDCQQLFIHTFSAQYCIPQREHQAIIALDKLTTGNITSPAVGLFPCKYVPSPCNWSEVTCKSGHVVEIDMRSHQLIGEIPVELGSLPLLAELYLSDNQLSGSIPPELGNLSSLQVLDLSGNQLSGEIPTELGNLPILSELNLAGNQLSGEIPPELGNLSQLQELYLGINQLSGEIPAELSNLSQLGELYLGINQLSGPLPEDMIELPLELLSLSHTELCIPHTAEFEVWIVGIDDHDLEKVSYCE